LGVDVAGNRIPSILEKDLIGFSVISKYKLTVLALNERLFK